MPEILKTNGVYSHLVSDHQHYWEDGGGTYHTRYSTWEINRGQEGDPWKGHVEKKPLPPTPFKSQEIIRQRYSSTMANQDEVNRQYMRNEEDMPQVRTFQGGLEFIEKNKNADKWFLQIETFDPHEPFFASQRFRDMYPDEDYNETEFDWPPYAPVMESDAVVQHGRKRYAALLSMCDHYLGKVLDKMDELDMWKDTMLIVNTDHGYLLGEHGWWAKSAMPLYNEIANIPFFIWDPRAGVKGERRSSLVQTIDIAPTILDFFGLPIPESMQGKALRDTVQSDASVRDAALFGYHGAHVNITDGTYVFMRAPQQHDNKPLYEYTLMPTHMRARFSPKELQNIELAEPFTFTMGCKTIKIEMTQQGMSGYQYGDKLFNIKKDPGQLEEIEDVETEARLLARMRELMAQNDSPGEQYQRLGIPEGAITAEFMAAEKNRITHADEEMKAWGIGAERGVYGQIMALMNFTPAERRDGMKQGIIAFAQKFEDMAMTKARMRDFILSLPLNDDQRSMMLYFTEMAGRTM
jgi:arylsulfatase A-like enzyme